MSASGITRRELVQRGGLLALPALLGRRVAAAEPFGATRRARPAGPSRASDRARDLPVDRRAALRQRAGHVHDPHRLDDAAGAARGDGGGLEALRPPRRAGRGDRQAPRRADAGRVGHGQHRLRRRPHPRDGGLRDRRQPRPPRPRARPARLPEGRVHHPEALAQRLRRGGPRRGREGRRGRDRRGAGGGLRAADGAHLHPRRAERRRGAAQHEGPLRRREEARRARPRGLRGRDPHRAERPPAARRRPRHATAAASACAGRRPRGSSSAARTS